LASGSAALRPSGHRIGILPVRVWLSQLVHERVDHRGDRLGLLRALGEHLQERVCFANQTQRRPGPGQLGLGLLRNRMTMTLANGAVDDWGYSLLAPCKGKELNSGVSPQPDAQG
jgi:hypothetical protein